MMKISAFTVAVALLGAWCHVYGAQPLDPAPLPEDFPAVTAHLYDANAVAAGYVFLAVAAEVPGVGHYLMVLDNDGTPVWYRKAADEEIYDFKVLPNGLLHYAPFLQAHPYTGGGDVLHTIMDENFNIIEEITPGSGYVGEGHDFQLLPNGHVLLFCYYMTQVDMSQLMPGGYPNAQVSGAVIQELDNDRQVVLQWRTWDHFPFEPSGAAVTAAWHLNSIFQDTDGHIVFGTPAEVKKINRQTGEVLWRLGGSDNEFTFVGEGADVSHMGGHTFHRLENGHVLIYDNGDRQGRRPSQVHEYALDEENRIATLVWSYVPDQKIPAWHRGSAQRLPNGNTFIGWGGASGKDIPAATEVTRTGEKVWELYFDNRQVESYRAFRFVFPSQLRTVAVTEFELATGNTYRFAEGQTDTGVTIKVVDRVGDGYNEVTVQCAPYAPVYPSFAGKAPRVLPIRVEVDAYAIQRITAEIRFATDGLSSVDPNRLTVYQRSQAGQGVFRPLPTQYNWVTKQLTATMDQFGEFIFGYPDLEEIPFAPQLLTPAGGSTVNQGRPVRLEWTPHGFAHSYALQIARDPDFREMVVDEPHRTEAIYSFTGAEQNTSYYWRVRTANEGGVSDWSTGVFATIPPMLQVTVPNGGEQWRRGMSYFIQWEDNLEEEVMIELYEGDILAKVLATVASTGAYNWQVPLNLPSGGSYAIKVTSIARADLTDTSDTVFAIK